MQLTFGYDRNNEARRYVLRDLAPVPQHFTRGFDAIFCQFGDAVIERVQFAEQSSSLLDRKAKLVVLVKAT